MDNFISVSGPRGGGKETIVNFILSLGLVISRVVPFTTRQPRTGEEDGREYNFIKKEYYLNLDPSQILYCTRIGDADDPHHYFSGTLKEEFDKHKNGIIDITAEGARILEKSSKNSLKLFIFAHEDERIARVMSRQKLGIDEAKYLVKAEPCPGTVKDIYTMYHDFEIILNYDGQQQRAFTEAEEVVKDFLAIKKGC